MTGPWLAVLERQGFEVGWDDLLVGHDFGLAAIPEIQARVPGLPGAGPEGAALAALQGPDLVIFEARLWAAVREATGQVPRPGGRRWALAQDRWRTALLLDALAAPLGGEALALAVESIYEKVGCPEDMLDLWKRSAPWEGRPREADRKAIENFLRVRHRVTVP